MEIEEGHLISVSDWDIVNGTIEIPAEVYYIDQYAFHSCRSLERLSRYITLMTTAESSSATFPISTISIAGL